MDIDIRKSVIKNFEGSGIEDIRDSIESSIEEVKLEDESGSNRFYYASNSKYSLFL